MTELNAELERAYQKHILVGDKYIHYKSGEIYKITGFLVSENNNEIMVSYVPFFSDNRVNFVRPLSEWSEIINGKPRFQRIKERTISLTDEEYTSVGNYIKSLRNE